MIDKNSHTSSLPLLSSSQITVHDGPDTSMASLELQLSKEKSAVIQAYLKSERISVFPVVHSPYTFVCKIHFD